MLKRVNRLSKDKDFDSVFKNGKSNYQKLLGIKLIENNLEYSRFGILVGLKISKKAVERNKIKRQIKSIIFLEEPFLKKGYDCVVVTFPLILGKNYDEIRDCLKSSFKRLNFYA